MGAQAMSKYQQFIFEDYQFDPATHVLTAYFDQERGEQGPRQGPGWGSAAFALDKSCRAFSNSIRARVSS